jgi:hypothetical protein
MQGTEFDEAEFFRRVAESGARALLIGRRALVVLGLPVLTADYDFWIHPDDIAIFNGADAPFDVLIARSLATVDGVRVAFDEVWSRRRAVSLAPNVTVFLPALDDLILTKRFPARPKDLEDIRLLQVLKAEEER